MRQPALLYVPQCLKLTSALVAQRDHTIEQEISFFIGRLVTLLQLLMWKRLWSVSSCFNLRSESGGISDDCSPGFSVCWCLDPQSSPGVWSSTGRVAQLWLKCRRSAGFCWLLLLLSSPLLSLYSFSSSLPSYSLFLFSCSAPLSHPVFSLSCAFVYCRLFICGNWMTPPLPEPGELCLNWAMVCYSMNITTTISLLSRSPPLFFFSLSHAVCSSSD